MAGGNRKDDSVAISSSNVFAALGSLKKKKKSEGSSKKGGSSRKESEEKKEQVFWAPAPLTVKSWADVDDEDDDDYYATTAPPPVVWGDQEDKAKGHETPVEESESEDEGLDEIDDDNDEENDHEAEVLTEKELVAGKPAEVLAPKDTDRQLSKKELKKKELAELDAVLAELGLNDSNSQEDTHGAASEKVDNQNGEQEKKDKNIAGGESKSAKKKKKKDKASKDTKEQELSNEPETGNPSEPTEPEKAEDSSGLDVKEKIKKMASMKKKKSSKEMDTAARAAASEAAARSARLAAAKKKEKSHYNQQPVRYDDLDIQSYTTAFLTLYARRDAFVPHGKVILDGRLVSLVAGNGGGNTGGIGVLAGQMVADRTSELATGQQPLTPHTVATGGGFPSSLLCQEVAGAQRPSPNLLKQLSGCMFSWF